MEEETLQAFNTTIMKIIKYPLLTIAFSEAECQKIIKLTQEITLAYSNFCKKLSIMLRYSTKNLMGLGIRSLYIVQSIKKLALYLEERECESIMGTLIRANFEAALMHLRIGKEGLFDLDYKNLSSLLLDI